MSWLLQAVAGWYAFAGDAAQHGSQPLLFGPEGFIWHWLADKFENWQSEFLQLFTMVVLTAFLIYRGELMIERIERRIVAMEGSQKR